MMKASVSTTKETPEADTDGDGDTNMVSTPTPAQEVDESPAEPEESTLDVAAIHRKRKRRSKSGSGDAGAGGSSRKKGTGTTYCVNKNSELRLKEMNLEKQGFEVKDGSLYCVACNVFSGTKKSSIMQHLRSDKHIRNLAARPAQYKRDDASRVVLSYFRGPASPHTIDDATRLSVVQSACPGPGPTSTRDRPRRRQPPRRDGPRRSASARAAPLAQSGPRTAI